jgi:hypothetical protein
MYRIVAIAVAACSLGSFAHAADSAEAQQRSARQQQRIQQGLDSGALSDREAARLEHGQARTHRIMARSAADGRVGPLEQARIQSVQNRQSRHIYRKKHNLRHH